MHLQCPKIALISPLLKNTPQICLILHHNLYVLLICGKKVGEKSVEYLFGKDDILAKL